DGRRYSDGLHQAIEAKENVKIEAATQTYATVTLQNYFRMYHKLAGMTGTAETEAAELWDIYKLDVVSIPTNVVAIRKDEQDLVFKTKREKFGAVIDEIVKMREAGRPVLVGTTSVEVSELLSRMLRQKQIPHNVLNAKQHAREAQVVAEAGLAGAVTIATNMAGRGTDIKLGPGVKEAGGLAILGTERHESRRVDRQLRGRAGRQGDPGSSQFFVSLEDDLMRVFGSEKIQGLVETIGLDEDTPIENKMLTRGIENSQKRVEGRNFDIRKHVLQYDNVMNRQRELIYEQRQQVIDGKDMENEIWSMTETLVNAYVNMFTGDGQYYDDWDLEGLHKHLEANVLPKEMVCLPEKPDSREILVETILGECRKVLEDKKEKLGLEQLQNIERVILLRSVDAAWMEHIDNMEQLKQGIGLRAYGQNDPVKEYTKEGFDMFDDMIMRIQEDTVKYLFNLNIQVVPAEEEQVKAVDFSLMKTNENEIEGKPAGPASAQNKVGRNDLCPCGSGKKYKKCCGA
ncbi:MAG: SEC-C domain-containing protein, partial [Firmicutes bacterium]|nr:SEC-C domain-containing protein [Bacillota bacterium]